MVRLPVATALVSAATAGALTLPAQTATSAVAAAQATPETTAAPEVDLALFQTGDYLGPVCGYVTGRSGVPSLMTSNEVIHQSYGIQVIFHQLYAQAPIAATKTNTRSSLAATHCEAMVA
ncbi:uncharacterized protein AB675_4914 [Cyphellophora attinorum]|uniref:Uncharacterized protein n=1 Tax=Cyphellophora attinorum TaxID=1664694 RepID=A0A0N1GX01_9EURO|nr:uncharacterized protein AB675_4914 [Phialophora attinorum]KPI34622.1 hypothetical protein AB675_4914 [Phialophora attinorum]